jgi:hypothetical protein
VFGVRCFPSPAAGKGPLDDPIADVAVPAPRFAVFGVLGSSPNAGYARKPIYQPTETAD